MNPFHFQGASVFNFDQKMMKFAKGWTEKERRRAVTGGFSHLIIDKCSVILLCTSVITGSVSYYPQVLQFHQLLVMLVHLYTAALHTKYAL